MATDESEAQRSEADQEVSAISPVLVGLVAVGAFCTLTMLSAVWNLLAKYGGL